MVLPASERAPQVPPTCIARMREKANPAVDAARDAALQFGTRLQHGVQNGLILLDNRPGAIELMPIGAKREEELLDGDGKKASRSAIMLVVDTPSSYLFDANASRGRTRFFLRDGQRIARAARTNRLTPIAAPVRSLYRALANSPAATS